jgi:hypothetical protein
MILLCVGVIIAGTTFQSYAATYDVTATVPAEPPNGPAVITAPYHQQHVSNASFTVTGTCPSGMYAKLYRNAAFSGAANCVNNNFQIHTSLSPGSNDLQARVFNVTNVEGPTSPAVLLYYDDTTAEQPAPPSSVPTQLQVANVDNASYASGAVRRTSSNPTVTGLAPPYADIIVTFHSDPKTCKTKADGQGVWSCTLAEDLPLGMHRVDIIAITPDGARLAFPSFQISVVAGVSDLIRQQGPGLPLLINTDYQYQTHFVGEPFTWTMALSGGTPPYSIVIDWDDGSESKIVRDDQKPFSISHAFPEAKTYTINITSTDSREMKTTMQISAVVKGESVATALVSSDGPVSGLLNDVRQYLWIVWPVYLAVVLMVFSYWLGEQEVYQRLTKRRLNSHPPARRR